MTTPFRAGQLLTAAGLDAALAQGAVTAVAQPINSTTPSPVSGFSFPVAAATYIVQAHILLDANASSGPADFRFTGPSVSLSIMDLICHQTNTLDQYPNANASDGAGYNTGFIPTQDLADVFFLADLKASFTFTAAGTLSLECANEAGASPSFNVYEGSWMSVLLAWA